AWGVILIIDFFVLNRERPDVPGLYESPESSRYGDIRWRSLVALLVGLVGGWAFEFGGVSLFRGPVSRATGGVDFSWLASIVFGGLAYWLPCRPRAHLATTPSLPAGQDHGGRPSRSLGRERRAALPDATLMGIARRPSAGWPT